MSGATIVAGGAVQAGAAISVASIAPLLRGGDAYAFCGLPFTLVGVTYQQSLANFLTGALAGAVTAAVYPVGEEGWIFRQSLGSVRWSGLTLADDTYVRGGSSSTRLYVQRRLSRACREAGANGLQLCWATGAMTADDTREPAALWTPMSLANPQSSLTRDTDVTQLAYVDVLTARLRAFPILKVSGGSRSGNRLSRATPNIDQ